MFDIQGYFEIPGPAFAKLFFVQIVSRITAADDRHLKRTAAGKGDVIRPARAAELYGDRVGGAPLVDNQCGAKVRGLAGAAPVKKMRDAQPDFDYERLLLLQKRRASSCHLLRRGRSTFTNVFIVLTIHSRLSCSDLNRSL